MSNKASHFAFFLERTMLDVMAQCSDLSDDDLNRPLEISECNTLFALAIHLLESANYWVLGTISDQLVKRDRQAEFQARGTRTELLERYGRWMATMKDTLNTLPDEHLDQPVPGEEPLTVCDGFLHAIQHCSLHLGHIQLSRQMLGYRPPEKYLPNVPAGPLEVAR